MVTTHTEGRVVTHSGDEQRPVEVVQLPARDAAVQAAAEEPPKKSTRPADPPAAAAAPATGKTMHAGAAPTAAKAKRTTKRR